MSAAESRPSAVRVRVPASSANLGPGFDCLGLALSLYDEVSLAVTDGGLAVDVSGAGAATVARDETNLLVRALRVGLSTEGLAPGGLALSCVLRIPHGRGLGSSAGAVVAGLLAARALAGGPTGPGETADLLPAAAALEGHPDNVAACLLGGLTLAWVGEGQARAVRLDPHESIAPVVLIPTGSLDTGTARRLLPATVPHSDAAANSGRAALLVHALTTDPSLLLAATQDRLHQRYRATAMPDTLVLVDALRAAGVAAAVSGAGPSVVALPVEEVSRPTLEELAALAGPGWSAHRLPVDMTGAAVSRC